MNRPMQLRFDSKHRSILFQKPHSISRCRGYTLIEILVSTTLSLLLLGAVVQMFAKVGEGITDSRSMLESADRLRVVQARLQQDLAGITVTMNPPVRPEDNAGYFEYIEGPITQENASTYAVDTDNSNQPDSTVGDFDDILMFTTRSTGRPFVGKYGANTIQSDVAEVAWFLRGRTLHRRVLLVAPGVTTPDHTTYPNNFYVNFDLSARVENNNYVLNTLGDLTRRECRFAHRTNANNFPYSVAANWYWTRIPTSGSTVYIPTLPTINECSSSWAVDRPEAGNIFTFDKTTTPLDLWSNNPTYQLADNAITSTNGSRIADDVVLTNVIGFDVKVWDPDFNGGIGGYVDLGYGTGTSTERFSLGMNHPVDKNNNITLPNVYDTWSTHYETVGTGLVGDTPGQAVNGFDDDTTPGADENGDGNPNNDGNGVVDDDVEKLTSPPYPVPLRGIQVKIRVFEPDSRQIREVTVVQDFLPQ